MVGWIVIYGKTKWYWKKQTTMWDVLSLAALCTDFLYEDVAVHLNNSHMQILCGLICDPNRRDVIVSSMCNTPWNFNWNFKTWPVFFNQYFCTFSSLQTAFFFSAHPCQVRERPLSLVSIYYRPFTSLYAWCMMCVSLAEHAVLFPGVCNVAPGAGLAVLPSHPLPLSDFLRVVKQDTGFLAAAPSAWPALKSHHHQWEKSPEMP